MAKNYLLALVWPAALLWAFLLVLYGVSVDMTFFRPLSLVSGLLTFAIWAFDKWAWRMPILYPWFVPIPYLGGSWKGQLISNWVDPETGVRLPPVEVYMIIRQTFSSINMRLVTSESASQLLVGRIITDKDGLHTFVGTYCNTPRQQVRHRSPIHYGGFLLQVGGMPACTMEGFYWTDRGTQGELNLRGRSSELYYDYSAAAAGRYIVC